MKENKLTNQHDYPVNDTRHLKGEIRIKPSTLKEICLMYNMTYKNLRSCLAPIMEMLGPKRGRLLTVHQVEMIVQHIGLPYTLKEP